MSTARQSKLRDDWSAAQNPPVKLTAIGRLLQASLLPRPRFFLHLRLQLLQRIDLFVLSKSPQGKLNQGKGCS